MEQQTIEKAAKETLTNEHVELQATKVGTFQRGFAAGAQWRINSVWHDARKDIPEEFIPILVERDDFTFSVNMVGGNMASCPLHWVRWAYVIDLLPERKEETNGGR